MFPSLLKKLKHEYIGGCKGALGELNERDINRQREYNVETCEIIHFGECNRVYIK